jgi:hypothetical protein
MRALPKTVILGLLLGALHGACLVARQLPASFSFPILGYVADSRLQAVRPIVGIAGSSRIEAPLELGLSVRLAAFLRDQIHAIIASSQEADVVVIDLRQPSQLRRIERAPSSVAVIRTSRDGRAAALYYPQKNQLLVVDGLPATPAVRSIVDLTFSNLPLRRFAISDDGAVTLLAFSGEESDVLYEWTPAAGPRFVTTASRVSDMIFLDDDAVIADSGSDQIVVIRGVAGAARPVLLADAGNGISDPAALSLSTRNEIYVGNGDGVLVMNASGHILRRLDCGCTVTTMMPLEQSAIRLTDQFDKPIYILDGSFTPERILFVPALIEQTGGVP